MFANSGIVVFGTSRTNLTNLAVFFFQIYNTRENTKTVEPVELQTLFSCYCYLSLHR